MFSPIHSRLLIGLLLFSLTACDGPAPAPTSAPAATGGAASPAPATTAGAATPAGRSAILSELKNGVDARLTQDKEWSTAAVGEQILAGGGVRTGAEARARIETSDGSMIRIAANTIFELAALSPQAQDPVTKLTLDAGQVWVWVTKTLGAGSFEVETPSGVATVRGSLMSVAYDQASGRLTVTCTEGTCTLADRLRQNLITLAPGQQSEIGGAGLRPQAVRRMTRAQLQQWHTEFPEVRSVIQALLDRAGPEDTPTPPSGGTSSGGAGQTACDHPYFPIRPGATWSYTSPDGPLTWTVTSVTGDASQATAEMTFQAGPTTGTYHWTCDAGGLTSYDFGQISVDGFGVLQASRTSGAGPWLPAAEALQAGFNWTFTIETQGTVTLPQGAGTGEYTLQSTRASTVTGQQPVTVKGQSAPGLQIAAETDSSIRLTLMKVAAPGRPFHETTTMQLARGIGIVQIVTTGDTTARTTTLTDYSLPQP